MFATLVSAWEGMLPDPVSFSQYPEYAQRQMVAWNDARIVDESRRLDAAVDAFISQKNKAQWMTFAVNVLFLLATFVAFVATGGNPASFGFLAVPGVSIAFNIVRGSRADEDEYGM